MERKDIIKNKNILENQLNEVINNFKCGDQIETDTMIETVLGSMIAKRIWKNEDELALKISLICYNAIVKHPDGEKSKKYIKDFMSEDQINEGIELAEKIMANNQDKTIGSMAFATSFIAGFYIQKSPEPFGNTMINSIIDWSELAKIGK